MINDIPRGTFYFHVKDGQRVQCYSFYSGPAPRLEDLPPGETLEGPRKCPYKGCDGGADAYPPCVLCYE